MTVERQGPNACASRERQVGRAAVSSAVSSRSWTILTQVEPPFHLPPLFLLPVTTVTSCALVSRLLCCSPAFLWLTFSWNSCRSLYTRSFVRCQQLGKALYYYRDCACHCDIFTPPTALTSSIPTTPRYRLEKWCVRCSSRTWQTSDVSTLGRTLTTLTQRNSMSNRIG